ncbi:MAG TPA: hypothetical protein VK540_09235 [Polyangiaceae bacterium]|nr:hypothetical protein [Polyangiaceae bacterium]
MQRSPVVVALAFLLASLVVCGCATANGPNSAAAPPSSTAAAATGYTAELLARAVGPTGKVYGQNPKWVLEQYAEKWWSNRLTKPVKVNRAVFQALQPGGIYAIVDHSARAGADGTDAKAHPASLVPRA